MGVIYPSAIISERNPVTRHQNFSIVNGSKVVNAIGWVTQNHRDRFKDLQNLLDGMLCLTQPALKLLSMKLITLLNCVGILL